MPKDIPFEHHEHEVHRTLDEIIDLAEGLSTPDLETLRRAVASWAQEKGPDNAVWAATQLRAIAELIVEGAMK